MSILIDIILLAMIAACILFLAWLFYVTFYCRRITSVKEIRNDSELIMEITWKDGRTSLVSRFGESWCILPGMYFLDDYLGVELSRIKRYINYHGTYECP